MRRVRGVLLCCVLAAVSASPALAAEMTTAKSVAILDFENANKEAKQDDWLCAGMAETLITKLRQVKELRLVERKQIIKAMEELDFSTSDFFDSERSAQLAKFLKVDVLLVGGFQHYGGAIRITARFVDVSTGEVLEAVDITGKMDDIFDLQDELALKLIKAMGIATTRRERKTVSERPTSSLGALELYSKALKATDPDEMIKLFEQAIEADPNYKEAYNDLAVVYMGQGDYAHAIELLKKALDVDQSYFLPHFNLGVCYFQLGRLDESEREHRRAIEYNEHYTLAYLALAEVYLAQQDYRRAIESARTATELDPSDTRGYNLWGNALYGQERYEEAIAKYEQVLELDPEAAYAYYNIANCHAELGDVEKALAFHGKALEADPDYALPYYRRGMLYLHTLGDAHKAAIDLLAYIERAGTDADGYVGLAQAYVALDKKDKAKEALETAVELRPNDPNTLNELANLHYADGEYKRAEELYLAALKADPDFKYGYHNLGNYYSYVRNDLDTAADYYEKAFEIDNTYVQPVLELSLLEKRRERWDDMISWLMRGQRLDATNVFWPYYLGYAYDEKATAARAEGNTRVAERYTETADKHLREAAELDPNDPDIYNLLGNLRLNSGEAKEAVPYYKKALEANNDHLYANVNLGTAMRQLGQYAEAEQQFKRTLELDPNYAFAVHQLAAMYDEDMQRPDDAVTYYKRYLDLVGDDEQVKERIEDLESGNRGSLDTLEEAGGGAVSTGDDQTGDVEERTEEVED
jgi:tetratricopeptide (TPR) repeat protein